MIVRRGHYALRDFGQEPKHDKLLGAMSKEKKRRYDFSHLRLVRHFFSPPEQKGSTSAHRRVGLHGAPLGFQLDREGSDHTNR